MANSFREDSEGVASTVATLFALLCAVLFLQAAVISVIPAREYAAERNTSVQALQALDYLRYAAVGAAAPAPCRPHHADRRRAPPRRARRCGRAARGRRRHGAGSTIRRRHRRSPPARPAP